MLLLKTGLFGLLLLLCTTNASAQILPSAPNGNNLSSQKTELFHDLPKRMDVNAGLLASLLQQEVGARVQVPVAANEMMEGVVVSKSNAAEQRYKTVVVKLLNRPNTTFTVSAVRNEVGGYRYSGRLLSLNGSDAYEMVNEGGRFSLQKKAASDLVIE